MKIYLIGHSVADRIIHADGSVQPEKKPGGLWHSVNGMLPLLSEQDTLFPVTLTDNENRPLFSANYTRCSQSYIRETEHLPTVTLTLSQTGERKEEYTNLQERININDMAFADADGVLINMITGYDLLPEDIEKISREFKGPIYMDIHSLARGVDENMARPHRPIPDPQKWLQHITVLQANEQEAITIYPGTEHEAAKFVLAQGVKYFLVTKGKFGVRMYFEHRKETASVFLPGKKVLPKTEVGCGDVFGVVFYFHFLKNITPQKCLSKAIEISGNFVAGKYPPDGSGF